MTVSKTLYENEHYETLHKTPYENASQGKMCNVFLLFSSCFANFWTMEPPVKIKSDLLTFHSTSSWWRKNTKGKLQQGEDKMYLSIMLSRCGAGGRPGIGGGFGSSHRPVVGTFDRFVGFCSNILLTFSYYFDNPQMPWGGHLNRRNSQLRSNAPPMPGLSPPTAPPPPPSPAAKNW